MHLTTKRALSENELEIVDTWTEMVTKAVGLYTFQGAVGCKHVRKRDWTQRENNSIEDDNFGDDTPKRGSTAPQH
jgi:hypothetical protein